MRVFYHVTSRALQRQYKFSLEAYVLCFVFVFPIAQQGYFLMSFYLLIIFFYPEQFII